MTEKTKKPSENKRLGRGLSSLLGEVPVSTDPQPHANSGPASSTEKDSPPSKAATGQVRPIPIEWINPGPWQPRQNFDQTALRELASSIQHRGLIQPIIIRANPQNPARYELIAGERRWRAAQLAKLHEIPSLIVDYSDQQAAELSLIENIQRKDLSVIEEADGYQALIDSHHYTQEALAEIMGKSRSHIANLLRLRYLPDSVKAKLASGALTMGQVRPLIGHPDAVSLAEKIIAHNLSARAVEALVKSGKKPEKPSNHQEKSADIRALETRAETELGLALKIDWNEKSQKGRLSVSVTSLEQFDALLRSLKLI